MLQRTLLSFTLLVDTMLVGCAYPHLTMGDSDAAGAPSAAKGGAPSSLAPNAPTATGGDPSLGAAGGDAAVLGSGGEPTLAAGGALVTLDAGGTPGASAAGGLPVVPASGTKPIGTTNSGAPTTLGSGGSATASGGAAVVPASGGSAILMASGGKVASGGATAVGNGGSSIKTVISVGGSLTTATPVACTSSTNLMAEVTKSDTGNWIGGDPGTTSDDVCGVQGAIYSYSDPGLDLVYGTSDDTLQQPARDTIASLPTARLNACTNGKCCISGRTTLAPTVAGSLDYSNVWGAAIALSLSDGGNGTKSAYPGPAKGFVVKTSGTLSGQSIRIQYTQKAEDAECPFAASPTPGTVELPFTSVTCPDWFAHCMTPGNHPYDLQIQVVGGQVEGPYTLCIDSITPIL